MLAEAGSLPCPQELEPGSSHPLASAGRQKQPRFCAVNREPQHSIWIPAQQLALTDILLSSTSIRARKMQSSVPAEGFLLTALYRRIESVPFYR